MKSTLYRGLLRFLPRGFRERHGEAMEEVFLEALEEARRGPPGGRSRLWVREAVDLARTGAALRASARRHGAAFVARHGMGRTGGGTMGLLDDVRFAMRSVSRRPAFAIFAATTVGLGVGATTTVFGALDAVLLRPLPIPGGDRVVMLWQTIGNSGSFVTPSAEQIENWSGLADVFESVVVRRGKQMTLTGEGTAERVTAALVEPEFHAFMGQHPVLGRSFSPDELAGEGRRVVLLGHGLWSSRFGRDPAVLGSSLTLDGDPWTVIGVMPRRATLPAFRHEAVDVWAPLPEEGAHRGVVTVAKLHEGVTVEQANRRLEQIQARMLEAGTSRAGRGGRAVDMRQLTGAQYQASLRVLAVAVLLLLVTACGNVANLLLSRSAARRTETAIRSALGGSRRRLFRQHLAESALLALVGGAIGLALAYGSVEALTRLRPERLDALDALRVDARVIVFAFAVSAVAVAIFGVVPAWRAGRARSLDALKGSARAGGSSDNRLRWALVSLEVALSFVLLVGSTVLIGTLAALQRKDPSFRADEVAVVTVDLPEWKYESEAEREALFASIHERLARMGGAARVATASSVPPFAGVTFGTVETEDDGTDGETHVFHGPLVGPEYFATLGQPILEGRSFDPAEFRDSAQVFVLGEAAARRFFPAGDAVGSRMRIGEDDWHTVVGVAADVPMSGLSSGAVETLQLYQPQRAGWDTRTFALRAASGRDPGGLLPRARAIVLDAEPEALLPRLDTAEGLLAETLAHERFTTTLLVAFATLALLLSAVGLYGVVSQVVSQRTREIGIRMALGARAASIRGLVLSGGGLATVVGVAAGAAAIHFGSGFLSGQVFGLERVGASAHAAAAVTVALTTLLATWLPTARALRVDPVEAMRAE